MDAPVYNIFGSADSSDYDIMVVIPNPLKISECHKLAHALDAQLATELSDKKVNTNLCCVDNGSITWTFKGPKDESQNSLLTTYSRHTQKYPCIVDKMVERNYPKKVSVALRGCLSTLTRTEGNREITKKALRTDTIISRLDCFDTIDIRNLVLMDNCKTNHTEIYKTMAFQFGQLQALLEGVELFDKQDVADRYPDLSVFLLRMPYTEEDLESLNTFKNNWCSCIRSWLSENPEHKTFQEVLSPKNT